jgi:hypothetical protein
VLCCRGAVGLSVQKYSFRLPTRTCRAEIGRMLQGTEAPVGLCGSGGQPDVNLIRFQCKTISLKMPSSGGKSDKATLVELQRPEKLQQTLKDTDVDCLSCRLIGSCRT